MKKLILLIFGIFLISLVSGATYYVTTPTACPSSDATNFPGQNCAPDDICGDSSGTAQCYATSTMNPPAGSSTTTGAGGTNYACSDVTCDGGYVTNCYAAIDSGAPFCDNNGAYLCDRNSTCYNKHVQTTCNGGLFVDSTCSATCTTNYFQCDGSTTDADGCEIQAGVSCGSGTGTVVFNQCYSATAGNCTSSTRYDCDNDDTDSNLITCNGANGCEILGGGSCTVGPLSGTYSGCDCIVSQSNFVTGNFVEYQTNASQGGMLWFKDHSETSILINISNVKNDTWLINSSGCIKFMDDSWQCTASSGSGDSFNQTYHDYSYNHTLDTFNLWGGYWYNQTLDTYNLWNSIWIDTYNESYAGLINNASYFDTYNATYDQWAYNMTIAGGYDYNHTLDVYNLWNSVWLSTYNESYIGLINNASYLDTFNSTYDTEIKGLIQNSSYLDTFNQTYHDYSYNYTIDIFTLYNSTWDDVIDTTYLYNHTLDTYNLWNNVWLDTYNETYNELILDNASLYSTYNATYDAGINGTFNQTLTDELYEPQSTSGETIFTFSNGRLMIKVT